MSAEKELISALRTVTTPLDLMSALVVVAFLSILMGKLVLVRLSIYTLMFKAKSVFVVHLVIVYIYIIQCTER